MCAYNFIVLYHTLWISCRMYGLMNHCTTMVQIIGLTSENARTALQRVYEIDHIIQ